jgi:hypothetical protein
VPIWLGALASQRAAIVLAAGVMTAAVLWLERRLDAFFFGYAIWDIILAFASLPATLALGGRYVALYVAASIGWFALAWSAAPLLTRALGL